MVTCLALAGTGAGKICHQMAPWELEEQFYQRMGKVIVGHMGKRQMTTYKLSRQSGVSFVQLDRYIRQGRRMPAFALYRIANALGVTVAELMPDHIEEPEQLSFDL